MRQTWGEYRVFYHDDGGTLMAPPASWTDVADPDPFVTTARGRSCCRPSDLLRLCDVVAGAEH